jgi:hypothetical protein
VDDRKALLMAWLQDEGERHHRLALPLSAAKDPEPRGWVQVGVCAIAGALTVAIFICWLGPGRERVVRLAAMERLREEGFRSAAGDPNESSGRKEDAVMIGSSGGAFGLLLCFRAFAIAFGTVIGALLLRVGCRFYNRLVGGTGSPSSVPEPLFRKAVGITFVTALVNAVMGFQPLPALVGFLVMATLISALLPTTFTRGMMVVLCYILVGIVVVAAFAVIVAGLILILAPLR